MRSGLPDGCASVKREFLVFKARKKGDFLRHFEAFLCVLPVGFLPLLDLVSLFSFTLRNLTLFGFCYFGLFLIGFVVSGVISM